MIERKCQACGKIQDRSMMIKISRIAKLGSCEKSNNKENQKNEVQYELKINPTSKELGRSLYVCKSEECIKNLIKKKRIKGALKFSNSDEIKRIEAELLKIVQQ